MSKTVKSYYLLDIYEYAMFHLNKGNIIFIEIKPNIYPVKRGMFSDRSGKVLLKLWTDRLMECSLVKNIISMSFMECLNWFRTFRGHSKVMPPCFK